MKRLAWSVLLLLPGVALAQAEGGDAPLSAEPIPLSIGVPVTTEQSANESVSYLFVADPGRTYLFELEQQVLDFVVSVETPSGEIRTFWSPLFRDESEYVLLETIDGGPYRINVESQDLSNARGRHTITASSLDADTSGSQYVEAWRLMSDAAAANSEGSSSQAVLDRYERAARLWRELGEVRMETQSLYCAAWVRYWQLGDAEGAAAQASAVAERYARLERPSLEANAILLQATALMRAAQLAGEDGGPIFDQALEAFRKSYAMHDALENLAGLAAVENQLGLAYFNRGDIARGDYREAAAHLGNAEQLLSDLGDWRDALNARHNLALIDLDQGYAAEAARELEAILPAIPEGVDRRFRGIVLTNLGFAHQFAGRFDAALRAFSDALSILRTEERSEAWVGHALRGLGSTYHAVGEHERAMGFLRQALDKASNDGRIRASILATLGNVTYLTADFAAALDLHEQSVHSTTSTDARTYREVLVVRDLVALDRFDEAIRMAGELLSGSDMSDVTRADLSIELGHAYLGLDDVDSSIELFELAFGVHDALGLRAAWPGAGRPSRRRPAGRRPLRRRGAPTYRKPAHERDSARFAGVLHSSTAGVLRVSDRRAHVDVPERRHGGRRCLAGRAGSE
jgi:tetratricopeptide (TPR) repeat protein